VILTSYLEGRAMVYVVSRWPFTAETLVQFQASPCCVRDRRSCTGTGLLSEYFGFPHAIIILPVLRAHSGICYQRSIILAVEIIVKENLKIICMLQL
jgi:hypothetical protein